VSVLDHVARRIPVPPNDDCVRVGIDGPDASGKTFFADGVAAALRNRGRPVVRVSVDDFHQVRAVRYRLGRGSAEGFWLHAFDYGRLLSDVLDPLAPRMARRDGLAGPDLSRYVDAQRIYVAQCSPRERAAIVIDNTDHANPRLVRP
jgi:uridine kinase